MKSSLVRGSWAVLFFCLTFSAFAQDANAPAPTSPTNLTPGQQVIGPAVVAPGRPAVIMLGKPTTQTPFTNQDAILQELYDLFDFDLKMSNAFVVYTESYSPQAAYLFRQDAERGTIDYIGWKQLKVDGRELDYLAKVELVPRGEGQFALNLLVFDLVQETRAIGRAYGGEPHPPFPRSALRRAGHKATSDVISTLTNDRITPITESRFAFVNQAPGTKTKEICLIDYDGHPSSFQRITYYNSSTLFPDWSPTGDALAYVSLKDDWADSFIQYLGSGEVKKLAAFKGTNTTPRWAPDNQNLAISLSAEGNAEIYLMSKNGGKPLKRLTHNPAADISPDFSPSGNQIAFTSDRSGAPKIYIMDSEGAATRLLSYIDRKCDTPFWSPVPPPGENDLRVAFCGFYDNLQGDIYTVRPDGQGMIPISDGRSDNKNPTWSPNAHYVAFASNRGGKYDIYIARSDGKPLATGDQYYRVTKVAGDNLQPSWSPN
ncbi:MAG: hypothetical protein GC154_08695 [bacterium]|nr:hypothetical protein [bacterium]